MSTRRDLDLPLYFLHIPKTAGMSLGAAVESHYPPDAIFRGYLLPDLLDVPPQELAAFRLFRGHFGLVLPRVLRRPLQCVTVLRDPMERVLSHYLHVRREPAHYFHQRVNRPGYHFSDFIRDPPCRPLIENVQARFLVSQDAKAGDWHPPVEPSHPLHQQVRFELRPLRMRSGRLRRLALGTLRRALVVGVTERLDETIELLDRVMQWAPSGDAGRVNPTPDRPPIEQIERQDLDLVRRLNRVDIQLHRWAARRLQRDLSRSRI